MAASPRALFLAVTGVGGAASMLAFLLFRTVPPKSMPLTLPGTKADFVRIALEAVNAVSPEISADAKKLIIAMSAFETGWGRTTGFKDGNNMFNIIRYKNHNGTWSGPVVDGPDTEFEADGSVKKIVQPFAAYGSPAESVQHFFEFLDGVPGAGNPNNRYPGSKDLLLNGDLDFLDVLYAGHYFTLPVAKYKGGVASYLETVGPLVDTQSQLVA